MLLQAPVVLGDSTQSFFDIDVVSSTLKFFFVLAAVLYTIFAFVVTRQIRIMRGTLITTFSPVFTLLGYIHLAFAALVTLFFFLVL